MFDDNRSNEELTWGGGIRDTSAVCVMTTVRNYTNYAAFLKNLLSGDLKY